MAAPKKSFGFDRTKRLTHPAEFDAVRKEGVAYRGNMLILGVRSVPGERAFRVGLVTSRRLGAAVVRNRIRRRLREIVRQQQHALRAGSWIVIVARPASARATTANLRDEWLRLASRASILAA